jgi:hypothetical protein
MSLVQEKVKEMMKLKTKGWRLGDGKNFKENCLEINAIGGMVILFDDIIIDTTDENIILAIVNLVTPALREQLEQGYSETGMREAEAMDNAKGPIL